MAGGAPGGYDLPGGAPLPPKKNSGTGCIIWGLVGCGGLAVVAVILASVFFWKLGQNPNVKKFAGGIGAMVTCSDSLVNVRSGLEKYLRDHNGKYPSTLSALVPKYLPDENALGCSAGSDSPSLPMVYTPPTPDSPEDAIVISVRTSEMSFVSTQNQVLYVRLLKDGRIVNDQVVRQELYPPGSTTRSRAHF